MIALWVSDVLQWLVLLWFCGYAMTNHFRITELAGKRSDDHEWLNERVVKIENELKARGLF